VKKDNHPLHLQPKTPVAGPKKKGESFSPRREKKQWIEYIGKIERRREGKKKKGLTFPPEKKGEVPNSPKMLPDNNKGQIRLPWKNFNPRKVGGKRNNYQVPIPEKKGGLWGKREGQPLRRGEMGYKLDGGKKTTLS